MARKTGSRKGAGARQRRNQKPKEHKVEVFEDLDGLSTEKTVKWPVNSWNEPPNPYSHKFEQTKSVVNNGPASEEEKKQALKENRENPSRLFKEAPEGAEILKGRNGTEYYLDNGHMIFIHGGWRRCPRCGALDTIPIRTGDHAQGRDRTYIQVTMRCKRPVCRKTFKAFKPN